MDLEGNLQAASSGRYQLTLKAGKNTLTYDTIASTACRQCEQVVKPVCQYITSKEVGTHIVTVFKRGINMSLDNGGSCPIGGPTAIDAAKWTRGTVLYGP